MSTINSVLKSLDIKTLLTPITVVAKEEGSYLQLDNEYYNLVLPVQSIVEKTGQVGINLSDIKKYVSKETDHVLIEKNDNGEVIFASGQSKIVLNAYTTEAKKFPSYKEYNKVCNFPNRVLTEHLLADPSKFLPLNPKNYDAIYFVDGFVSLTDNLIVVIKDVELPTKEEVRLPSPVVSYIRAINASESNGLSLDYYVSTGSEYTSYIVKYNNLNIQNGFWYREPKAISEHNFIKKVSSLMGLIQEAEDTLMISKSVLFPMLTDASKIVAKNNPTTKVIHFTSSSVEALSDDKSAHFKATYESMGDHVKHHFTVAVNSDHLVKAVSLMSEEFSVFVPNNKFIILSSEDNSTNIFICI